MRIHLAVVLVAFMSTMAFADSTRDIDLTRRILADDASSARSTRIGKAVALGAFGAGLAAGGYYLMQTEDYGLLGGPLERGTGYFALGVGLVTAIGAPTLLLLTSTAQDDVLAELDREIAAGNGAAGAVHARHVIEEIAARERRERRRLRIVGVTSVVIGAAGAALSIAYRDELGTGIRLPLGTSIVYGGIGALLLTFTAGPTTWERSHATFSSAALVPVDSGAVLAFSGALD